jgi:osmotically inducible lipoprotein OsmB
MKYFKATAVIFSAITLLAACGDTTGDRALSGGAIPVTGAIVGGAVGAATGGLTKKKDVDLGKPLWR